MAVDPQRLLTPELPFLIGGPALRVSPTLAITLYRSLDAAVQAGAPS